MLSRLTRQLDDFQEKLLSTNTPALAEGLPLTPVPDFYPGAAPLAGLHAALSVSRSSVLFCIPCDMPNFIPTLPRLLLERGIPSGCTAMQAIGYKEFTAALEGAGTILEAADQVRLSSRHYAKRQLTWFRRNKQMHWLLRKPGEGSEEILRQARQVLQENDT